jgi:hypothetical protein
MVYPPHPNHSNMCSVVNNFRVYTKKCRPLWTITWREAASPSIRSGIKPVRDEDITFNKKIAAEYIKKYGMEYILENIEVIVNHLNTKPENSIRYSAKGSWGYSHKIMTPEWQAMGYFLAILNMVSR